MTLADPHTVTEMFCPDCGSPLQFDAKRVGTCTFADCRHKWSYIVFPGEAILLYPINNQLIVEFLERAMNAPAWANMQHIPGQLYSSINFSPYNMTPYTR